MFAILENTTESVWAINPSYEILYTNHVFKTEFEATFGIVLEPGVNLLKSLPKPMQSLWKSRYDRALNNERFSFVDRVDVGDRSIYIEVYMHPILIGEKVVGASFFGSDITKRKLAEQTLKENETRLRELNLTKDKFFSIIAHDLKSPFNSILGFSDILLDQVSQKDLDGVEKSTEIIQKSAHHAVELLTNLLEWSQSQSGRIEFNPEYLELHALVDKVIRGMESLSRQKSIQITNHISAHAPIWADRYMLSSILRNLISNALKFTKQNGAIDIKASVDDEKMRVSVCDNGVGIPRKDLPKLFRIDLNHSTIGTMDEKGTGLGLILCKEFVEKHGGTIWAESQARRGSCFTFEIPVNTN
jgi:signal transduction histidine kinase